MDPQELLQKYRDLQGYVGWTSADAERVRSVAAVIEPHLPEIVDDFYTEIEKHPQARKVISGGAEQIVRLKGTLTTWLRQLLGGDYDLEYVLRRWQVGYRHVEIGLDQIFANVALARVRLHIAAILRTHWPAGSRELDTTRDSLDKLLDLELALINGAYQAEFAARQQRVERLVAIGQVAGGIAHELRNPLNVIKTSVYYLTNARSVSPAKTKEHLERIEKQVTTADSVITALSNYARLPSPTLRPFLIDQVVREALEAVEPPANIRVQIDLQPALPPVMADLDQVQIVFLNLFRNAYEAMPEGGELRISATDGDGHVEVAVTDTGHGIPPEVLKRIMEPFHSTKSRGIGLGLAISRSIVDRNQGTLKAFSEPGQGATFKLRLKSADRVSGQKTEN